MMLTRNTVGFRSPTFSDRHIHAAAILICCFFGLPGCGGSGSSSTAGSPPPPPPPTFTIGGTVSGLAAGSSVSILISGGGTYQGCVGGGQETLTVTSNGSFTSDLSFQSGACYAVGVPTSPDCHVLGASGTINAANVTNIQVTCEQLVVLWTFTGPDGAIPQANLMQATDGNFYGTTAYGGSGPCAASPTDQYPSGCGTVFRITPAGAETVLWNFGNNPGDGQAPAAPLIQGADGSFYGTTAAGGTNDTGTVFKITPDGTETVLWSFGKNYSSDGNQPTGSLIQDGAGNLYGITAFGGAYGEQPGAHGYGFGTVFRLSPAGAETILWSFGGYWGDGTRPDSLLLAADGNLYGTTFTGGEPIDYGTIFKLTPAGTESILWTFGKEVSGDGDYPDSLIQGQDGKLYGATVSHGGAGYGALFQLTLAPLAYTNLLAFGNPSTSSADVLTPTSLIQGEDGNFYGANSNIDCGQLFEVTSGADAALLWAFEVVRSPLGLSCDGPGYPNGVIQGSDGNLYGTTESSGATGYGSVFKLVP